jgi:hypothetical protein
LIEAESRSIFDHPEVKPRRAVLAPGTSGLAKKIATAINAEVANKTLAEPAGQG